MKKISIRKLKNPFYLLAFFILLLSSYLYKNNSGSFTQLFNLFPPTVVPTSFISTPSITLARVAKIIDGDTIELKNGKKVRYIGINTPELHDPRRKTECFGKEAMEKNKEIVEGKEVKLGKDVSEVDKYGRLLRYVYVPTDASPSGELINAILVKEGYALASTFSPDVKYAELFKSLEEEARKNRRGLWNTCGQ